MRTTYRERKITVLEIYAVNLVRVQKLAHLDRQTILLKLITKKGIVKNKLDR